MKTQKMIPARKIAALRRAERDLVDMTEHHDIVCGCVLCRAMIDTMKARLSITRPGWDINDECRRPRTMEEARAINRMGG